MIDEVPQQLHLPRNPELCVTVGQQQAGTTSLLLESSDPQFAMSAIDRFDELLQGIGADGSRAHSLKDACPVF